MTELSFKEPLKLNLDYQYNLNSLKEIKVTDSFLSLDKKTKGCQQETYNDCTTKNYLETLIYKCHCLPFQLKTTDNFPLCTFKEMECIKNIDIDEYKCLQEFSGLLVTSYDQNEIEDSVLSLILSRITELTDYMKEIEYKFYKIKEDIKGILKHFRKTPMNHRVAL